MKNMLFRGHTCIFQSIFENCIFEDEMPSSHEGRLVTVCLLPGQFSRWKDKMEVCYNFQQKKPLFPIYL